MNPLIDVIFWSMMPISELRGGIPVAIAQGFPPLSALLICVFANILVIPIMFFFLDYLHESFMKIKIYNRIFTRFIDKKRVRFEKQLEKHKGEKIGVFLALMLFVGIPLPVTGAYTGTILAWLFGIKKKEAYPALIAGVIMAGIIVILVVTLGLSTFSFFVKNLF